MMKISRWLILCLLITPFFVFAQENEEVFKARVIEIVESNRVSREDGSTSIQQKLKLEGQQGAWKDKEVIFDGTQIDVVSAAEYKVGDQVLVSVSRDEEGNENYYVTDHVRQGSLLWLAILFALVVVAIGRLKGLRALLALLITFLIILNFIIPRILSGSNPVFISIIGCVLILVLVIYLTEGFKKTSAVAVFSIIISLIITGLISIWFTALAKLTGFASEETMYLVSLAGGNINIQGLFLAGVIIGALGVLDDVVISQVMLVRELKSANPGFSRKDIYTKAMKVGVSHLSSMVNTLFLAYAGASLPFLILFSIKEPPFLTFGQVVNHEVIATEIVRTLAGSIGLVLAVPLATYLAVILLKEKAGRD